MAGAPPALGRQLTSAGDDPTGNTAAAGGVPTTGFGTGTSVSSALPSTAAGVYEVRLGGLTDPGVPGKNNQDDFFVWDSGDGQNFVLGVLDGHGRDLGALAANVAKKSLQAELSAGFDKIRADPYTTLVTAFENAHLAVKQAFKQFYESTGWVVTEETGGYLVRQRSTGGSKTCIHGGTTGTVVVVVDGRYVLVANVGDSSILLCGSGGEVAMQPSNTWTPMGPTGGSGAPPGSKLTPGAPSTSLRFAVTGQRGEIGIAPSEYALAAPAPASCSELSKDHGPECPGEFLRMRSFRPNPANPSIPELSFVYDTLTASKLQCPAIFEVGAAGGVKVTGRGTYYKNVRNEWATLVATPPTAAFQDALAFTRSIGDLHLQAYGVSHTPEVGWVDLMSYSVTPPGGAGPIPAAAGAPIVLCVCSDGVWDNWKFEDVSQFLLHPGRVEYALKHETSQACCVDLMQANLERARVNFGNSADNMTAVLAYMVPRKDVAPVAAAAGGGASGTGVDAEGDVKLDG